MTKRYAAKHGPNLKNTLEAIAKAQPFNAGNLKAKRFDYVPGTGRLPNEWREQLERDNPGYIVFSYGTPIGWLARRSNGKRVFVIPDVRYSPTTSAHQSVVRRAVGEYEETNAAVQLATL